MIIIISGKAGVGKTTFANFLKDYYKESHKHIEIIPFAKDLKRIAYHEFGWNGIKDESGRQLLINIGKIGRTYNIDIWVSKVLNEIYVKSDTSSDIFVIDDWRFSNELDYLKNHYTEKIVSLRIERPEGEILRGTPQYNDISETSLPSAVTHGYPVIISDIYEIYPYDYIIDGSGGTLSDFRLLAYRLGKLIDNDV